MMPDSRKVHLLTERDPVSDPPDSHRLVLESRGPKNNTFAFARYQHGRWGQNRPGRRNWDMPAPTWWADLPAASDLTVEDVEELIWAATEFAGGRALARTHSAKPRREGIISAVAKLRAALGMETP